MISLKYRLLFLVLWLSFSALSQDLSYFWAKQFGNDSYSNSIEAISSDHQNKIICFTHYSNSFTIEDEQFDAEDGEDILAFALNESGEKLWALSTGGTGNQWAQKVACDLYGNIYLMGKFEGQITYGSESFESNGSFDMYLIKLNNDGELIWIKTFGGPNSEAFETLTIKDNLISIGGRYYNYTVLENDTIWSVDGTDFFVAQFNLNGELDRFATFGGESVDKINDMAVDNDGNIYIAGEFYQNLQFGNQLLEAGDYLGLYLVKLDQNFDPIWVFQPLGNDLKPGVKLACDLLGRVALAGNFSGSISLGDFNFQTNNFDEDLYVAYFNPQGDISWASRYYSNSMEQIKAFEMDRIGHLYIGGQYLDHIHFNDLTITYNLCCGNPEIFFVKIDEYGQLLDHSQITGERSELKDIYVAEINQVMLAGHFSEALQIGPIQLNSPLSYNAFVSYYKDDTWLNNKTVFSKTNFLVNTVTNHSFELISLPKNSRILIYNINGTLVEKFDFVNENIKIGEHWTSGLYLIHIVSPNSESIGLKVLKL
jgi:hypothetical protein